MNAPLTTSKILGYKPDEIIKFLMKTIPGLDKKIEKALAAGYTTEQVFEFLRKQGIDNPKSRKKLEEQYSRPFTDEPGRLTETQRQQKALKRSRKQDFLTQTLDPKRIGSTAIGAGAGFAAGGPVGAIGGAMAGFETYDDLIRKYEEHKASGGTLSLLDFLKSIAVGGAKGAGSVALINTAKDMLNTIQNSGEQEPELPSQGAQGAQESPDTISDTDELDTSFQEHTEISEDNLKNSHDIFINSRVGDFLKRVSQDLNGLEARNLAKKMFGSAAVQEIERLAKKPFEEVYEEFKQYQIQNTRTPEPPSPTTVQEKQIPQDDESLQFSQIENLLQGEGLSVMEQEEARFEKGYGEQVKKEKPMQPIEGEVFTELFQKKVTQKDENIKKPNKPYQLEYVRNTKSSPQMGSRFGQDIEPAGRYMREGKAEHVKDIPGMESGKIEFENPLIMDWGEGYGEKGNWKNVLKEKYGGKTGKNLSQAIRNDGYDAIITQETDKRGNTYTSEIVDLTSFKPEREEVGTLQKTVKPLANSLKSSNVVGAFYDADTNKMRIVFRSGDMYEYDNITLDELEKVTGGKAKPITEGATQYGFWFPDKKKSVGAAFSKFIKKKADEFPYRKLDKSELRPNEEQMRDAVRTFNISGIFEPFKEQRKKGQQLEKGKVLREMEPALQDVDDDFLQEMVDLIESKLGLKTPIKVSRLQKEFRKEFM